MGKKKKELNPQWLQGLVDGRGLFEILVKEDAAAPSGYEVSLRFSIRMGVEDYQLLHKLRSFFGCGRLKEENGVCFFIEKLPHIREKVVPFFEKYPPRSFKKISWIRFRRVSLWLSGPAPLTEEKVKKILHLKSCGLKIESTPL